MDLVQIEWMVKSGNLDLIYPQSILDLINRIRFLEQRQSELQSRGTELVEENRRLKRLIELNNLEEEPVLFGSHIRETIKVLRETIKVIKHFFGERRK